jgi:hypothetical protein
MVRKPKCQTKLAPSTDQSSTNPCGHSQGDCIQVTHLGDVPPAVRGVVRASRAAVRLSCCFPPPPLPPPPTASHDHCFGCISFPKWCCISESHTLQCSISPTNTFWPHLLHLPHRDAGVGIQALTLHSAPPEWDCPWHALSPQPPVLSRAACSARDPSSLFLLSW